MGWKGYSRNSYTLFYFAVLMQDTSDRKIHNSPRIVGRCRVWHRGRGRRRGRWRWLWICIWLRILIFLVEVQALCQACRCVRGHVDSWGWVEAFEVGHPTGHVCFNQHSAISHRSYNHGQLGTWTTFSCTASWIVEGPVITLFLSILEPYVVSSRREYVGLQPAGGSIPVSRLQYAS